MKASATKCPAEFTLAMIGGLSDAPGDDSQSKIMVVETATVMTEALKSMNNGIRGFYFAVAAIFLFAGPYYCIFMTMVMSGLLLYRQGFSTTALAIERYVDAMNNVKK